MNMEMSIKYSPEIDGLRALAVCSVVLYHAFPELIPGGFIGVDIFFVISGYLVTSILLMEHQTGSFSILEFYKRRVNRIFPALLFVMISVCVFCWFTFFTDEYMQVGKHIAGGAAFVSNIVLYSESGYFDSSSSVKPFLHLWSLGVEEQYYIALPVLLWVLHRLRINLIAPIAIIAIVSFAFGATEAYNNQVAAFYLPQYRAWELFAGSIIACLSYAGWSNALPALVKKSAAISGTIIILACMILYKNALPFPGAYALLPVTGSCLIIMYASTFMPLNVLLSNKISVFIGLISYPLYLWHWPVISIMRIINGEPVSSTTQVLGLLLSISLACFTYIAIEKPLKRVRSAKTKTLPMTALMLMTGLFGYYVYANAGIETRGVVEDSKSVNRQLNGALWQYASNDNCLERYNFKYYKSMPVWFCELTHKGWPDVLLLGNSYANHLYPGIALHNVNGGINVLSIGTSDITYGMVSGEGSIGEKQMNFLNEIIHNSPSIHYVIVSGLNTGDMQIKINGEMINYPFSDYIDNFNKRIDFLVNDGKKVIIFAPHIKMNKNIKACFSRPLKKTSQDCVSDYKERDKLNSSFNMIKKAVQKRHPDVLFYDPNAVFCRRGICSSIIDGMPVYRDDYKHFSEYASRRVGDNFYLWAKKHAPDFPQ